jgi:predicted Zn-dependent peptidase
MVLMKRYSVQSERLDNGVTLIAVNRAGAATTALGLWIRAGAALEPPGMEGTTHLIEHLCFHGKSGSAGESRLDLIERLGGQINAGTAKESLSVQGWVPAALGSDWARLLGDMVLAPEFTRQSKERETSRIAQEAAANLGSFRARQEDLLRRAFPGHPLANPILGDPERLARLDPESLRRWWEEHLRGERIALIAVGAFGEGAMIDACRSLAARFPRGTACSPDPTIPLAVAARRQPFVEPEGALGWILPGPALGEPGEFTFRAAERWISRILEAHGFESVLDHYRAGSLWTLLPQHGTNADEAVRAAWPLLVRHAQDGPESAEIERSKQGVVNQLDLEQDDPVWTLTRLGEEWTVLGRARDAEEVQAGFASVTTGQVREILRTLLAGAVAIGG